MLTTSLRTHRAGALTRADAGSVVGLGGWIHRRRDLGGIVFLDLRDIDGLVQLSCDPTWTPADFRNRSIGSTGWKSTFRQTVVTRAWSMAIFAATT